MSTSSYHQAHQPASATSLQAALEGLATLRGCLIAATEYLTHRLHHQLSLRFTGNDDATRYITAPLLKQQGPLADTLLKARLLVALGSIKATVFDDIERLVKLSEQVLYVPQELEFSSPQILNTLGAFSQFDNALLPMFTQRLAAIPDDPTLRAPYLATINHSIRSAFVLALSGIEQQLNAEHDE